MARVNVATAPANLNGNTTVGNLFLHQRVHKGKQIATTPQPTKDRPFTELHLEELFTARTKLEEQRQLLDEEIGRRLETLGLQEMENRIVGVTHHQMKIGGSLTMQRTPIDV